MERNDLFFFFVCVDLVGFELWSLRFSPTSLTARPHSWVLYMMFVSFPIVSFPSMPYLNHGIFCYLVGHFVGAKRKKANKDC